MIPEDEKPAEGSVELPAAIGPRALQDIALLFNAISC
jgi:hypothetical protein